MRDPGDHLDVEYTEQELRWIERFERAEVVVVTTKPEEPELPPVTDGRYR